MTSQKLLSRSVQELNDNGTMGVSLPMGLLSMHDIEPGDEIQIKNIDTAAGELTLSLPD